MNSSTISQDTSKTDKLLTKISATVDAGAFYEAHQMYRSLYFRYTQQRRHNAALHLAAGGAVRLLTNGQTSSGGDLALLSIDALNNGKYSVCSETLGIIESVFKLIGSEECLERQRYIKSVVDWSNSNDTAYGHPDVHKVLADTLWDGKCFLEARYHYIHSNDGVSCGSLLVEFSLLNGFPSETDLFITQAVLQYLCLYKREPARLCFVTYTNKHPVVTLETPPSTPPNYSLPLLNFISLLLMAIEGGKLTVFTILCEAYRPELQYRDRCYADYLQRIGQLFFGLESQSQTPRGGSGLLDAFMTPRATPTETSRPHRPLATVITTDEDFD